MAARSPARFLAPLALLAFVIALFVVVSNTLKDSGSSGTDAKTSQSTPAGTSSSTKSSSGAAKKGPRFYRVKAGDTPSSIALKTGVALSQIQALNPDLDPQTLSPGQRLKIRR